MPTTLPNPRVSPRFAGLCTFCRYPRLEDVAPAHRPVDWAIFGVPHDAGVTYRPGARFGPRAIREASQYVKRYHLAHGVDVCETLSLADAGDAPVKPYDQRACLEGIYEWAMTLGASDAKTSAKSTTTKLFAVGGDHSIAYANLRATFDRMGKPKGGLALFHFDSHLDTVDQVWESKWGHASPFIRAIEDGLVNPRKMISVGIKGPLNTKDDLAFAQKHGVVILTAESAVRTVPRGAIFGEKKLAAFVRALRGAPAYITFDIDAVDPAFAPGTGTPCPGGFSSAQAFALLRACKGANIVGADVVEVLPDRDPSGITAFLAAHILFEILALDAATR